MTHPTSGRRRPTLTRRQLLARAGLLGAAGLSLPAALSSGALAAGSPGALRAGCPSPSVRRRRRAVLRELAGLHRSDRGRSRRHGRPLRRGDRDRHAVHGGVQRQQRVLRHDPAGARQRRHHRCRHHGADGVDGRAPDQPRVGGRTAARRHPQRRQSARRPRQPGVGSGGPLLAAVADRAGRDRLQPRGHRSRAHVDERPVRSRVQRPDRHAPRDERHDRTRHAVAGRRHLDDLQLLGGRGGVRQARAGQSRRADPGVHRQRLYQGPESRELRRLRRLVRRRRPARGRQPRHPLHHPRGGREQLGRHDGDAQGRRASRRGGEVDGLRLRPGAGGPTHSVHAVHLTGQGCAGGGGQDRSGHSPRTSWSSPTRRCSPTSTISPTSTRRPRPSSTKPGRRSPAP